MTAALIQLATPTPVMPVKVREVMLQQYSRNPAVLAQKELPKSEAPRLTCIAYNAPCNNSMDIKLEGQAKRTHENKTGCI
ncbi:hypothetical protein VNO80_24877 [Phaseolus coccineus]|uniref:Uncharacterized protein n=1 Tax=Phaseolus coccineus TaxID=3886 RepID=A0AAN9LU88_PHACN